MILTPEQRAWLANLPPTISTADVILLFRDRFGVTIEETQELLGIWIHVKWDEIGRVAA